MNMRSILPIVFGTLVLLLGACKEKPQSTDIITTKYVPKQPQPPIGMPVSSNVSHVEWAGRKYDVKVVSHPSDSLALVYDENNQPYKDNKIEVVVTRSDGSVFFKKVFTKSSFSSYIDDTFMRNGILGGIQYNSVETGGMEFSVVVGLPDALDDVFVPLKLTVDRQAGVHISKNDDMDMLDYDGGENDEE